MIQDSPAPKALKDMTAADLKAELVRTKSEFLIMAGPAGDVGIVFASLVDSVLPDIVVRLSLADAEDLGRVIRRVSKNVRSGRVGHKVER